MLRLSFIAWIVLILAMVIVLFNVKAQVEQHNRDLLQVNRQIAAEEKKIQVLRTEWSHLDHPDRIADLARMHLGYDTAQRPQIGQLVDLPMRATDRASSTNVLRINVMDEPINRLGPQPSSEILDLDSEIGGLRHIASPDLIGDLVNHLSSE